MVSVGEQSAVLTLKTALRDLAAVEEWLTGAAAEYGDPSVPVFQLVCRWVDDPERHFGEDVVCGVREGQFLIQVGAATRIPLHVDRDGPVVAPAPGGLELMSFGAVPVGAGVWLLEPSLNIPGQLHAFVVLVDVPAPAPWQRQIITPAGQGRS